MKTSILLFLFCFVINITAVGQAQVYTTKFKLFALETLTQTVTYDDGQHVESNSRRSTLVMLDEADRHCLLTVRLIEYKLGKQVADEIIFSKILIDGNDSLKSFEDSAMLFSLYRKCDESGLYTWGFRAPGYFKVRSIILSEADDAYQVVAIPQNFLDGKIPIRQSFPLLVLTTPDRTGNFPFYRVENRGRNDPKIWNEVYRLKHTFIIEMLIEPTDIKRVRKKNNKLQSM